RLTQKRILGGGRRWGGYLLSLRFFLELDQWLEPHLAVMVKPGAGWDNVTHDDVLLEAAQVIDPGARGGLGEHTCGILERGSAEEALGFDGGFGNTRQNWLRFGGFATHLLDALIFFLELEFVDLLTPKEGGIAGFSDAHLAEHLTDNDLDVFVVNGHTLKAVDFLHLVDEMF